MSNSDKSFREWLPEELTGWWFMNVGDGKNGNSEERSWEDCQEYNFMIAGGVDEETGKHYADEIKKLKIGYPLLAYEDKSGFVGAGIVLGPAVPQKDFVHPITGKTMAEMIPHLQTKPNGERSLDSNRCDWCVPVVWISDPRNRLDGVLGKEKDCEHFNRRGTCHRLDNDKVIHAALMALGVDPHTLNRSNRQMRNAA